MIRALPLLLLLSACAPSYSLSLTNLSLPPEPAVLSGTTLTVVEGTIVRATLVLEEDGGSVDAGEGDLKVESEDTALASVLKTSNAREIVIVAHAVGTTSLRARYRDREIRGLTLEIVP